MSDVFYLVTGANRGIGFEIAKQLSHHGCSVFLGARRYQDAQQAAFEINAPGGRVIPIELDVISEESVKRAYRTVSDITDRLGGLINNGGVFLDSVQSVNDVSVPIFKTTLDVNVVGPFTVIHYFLPLCLKAKQARIVNVSSDLGSMSQAADPNSPYVKIKGPAYRSSKAALNMLTLSLARSLDSSTVTVCACSPGWTQTDLDPQIDSSKAPNTVAMGADTPVWLSLEANEHHHGKFFANRKEISW